MNLNHVEMKQITVNDAFWKSYMELVRKNVIPYQWEALNDRIPGAEPSYCLENFRVASGKKAGEFGGRVFQDTDAYKWLEAVAFSLMWYPDAELEKTADEVIDLIGSAQQPDGYLDTYYIINGLEDRFSNLRDNHELYCLGHMLEAAIAYYNATGKRKFLDIAIKYVECVDREIGPEKGKKRGYPGHEIAEMALMKLYDITHEEKYLKLAKYFIDERGKSPIYFEEEVKHTNTPFKWEKSYFQYQYYQAGIPVRKQKKAEGHAVRAVYLYSGMADVARATGDKELLEACQTLWDNISQRQMYVTGSIGAQHYGESFSFDYDLPNMDIYGETCAAIGLVFFARRMFEATGESKYIDVMERALFNGVISGMSLDGKAFFYVNPLEVLPEAYQKLHRLVERAVYVRQKWFACACCPPNLARLLGSISEYAFGVGEKTFYINLFMGADVKTAVGGKNVEFAVEANLPWKSDLCVTVNPESGCELAVAIRNPEWSFGNTVKVNGEVVKAKMEKGYIEIERKWKKGDKIEVSFEMKTAICHANPKVRADVGKVAVVRGPVVYCLEEDDNGKDLHTLYLDNAPNFKEKFQDKLLGGVMTIEADGEKLSEKGWGASDLYKLETQDAEQYEKRALHFIPYYSWANRNPGEMTVWVHKK